MHGFGRLHDIVRFGTRLALSVASRTRGASGRKGRSMNTLIRGSVSALLLSAVVVTGMPLAASAEWTAPYDAVLYELNENMSLRALRGGHRKAMSQLLGFARAGSPLCPERLAKGAAFCTINATGSDNISLVTGRGKFAGTFTVVDQDDNPVDSPEAVLAKGRFSGKMDFSPAILDGIPYGTVDGQMALHGGRKRSFTGTFRLPFVMPQQDPACVAAYGPTQCAVSGYTNPMYLVEPDRWGVEYVDYSELAIGFPTVRFEITFD